MSVKVEKTENKNEVKLSFEIEAEKFDEAMQRVYTKTAKYFTIPGFRKGKAPMHMVERQYGAEIFYEDTFNEILPEVYENAIKENDIKAVSRPDIDITQIGKGQNLIFTAIVQVKPEVKLGKYKGIEIKKIEYNVSDEDVEHELGHMAENNSRLITVDNRPVQKGDITTIDFEGSIDGVPFEGGKAQNHELEIGSNTFIPGFEDQVIGMNIGEEKDITVNFPEEYFSKDLAGKPAVFKIKLHEIKEKELPVIDDEFAKDVSEFDTLDELKNSIKEKRQKENDEKAKMEIENAVIEKVCENAEVDIPSSMIETEIDDMLKDIEQRLVYQGLTLEQYYGLSGKTEVKVRDEMKEQAEKTVKTRLVLEEITKQENTEVDEKELEKAIEDMANAYQMKPEDIKEKEHMVEYLKTSLKAENTIKILTENAKIK